MTHTEYRSLTAKQMAGMRWKARRPITNNGGKTIQAGEEVKVVGKWRGLQIEAASNPAIYITKVAPEAIIELRESRGNN